LIIAKQLVKKFNGQTVLDQLDLKVAQGDRIALIGANGAGKTTLIRSILGQYQIQGELKIFGKDPRKERVKVLEQLAFVPQHSPPFQMTVSELVNFSNGLSAQSSLRAIIEICSAMGLDIEAHFKKPFVKLSGGMQQKVLLSLALSKKPALLIMDEPAANLDPAGRKAFFHELSKLDEKTTIILSSHRVDEVLSLINRIVEMDCGKIVVDERIGRLSAANEQLSCHVELLEEHPSALKKLKEWDFKAIDGPLIYQGSIAGEDRLRFINSLSHYANYIKKLHIN